MSPYKVSPFDQRAAERFHMSFADLLRSFPPLCIADLARRATEEMSLYCSPELVRKVCQREDIYFLSSTDRQRRGRGRYQQLIVQYIGHYLRDSQLPVDYDHAIYYMSTCYDLKVWDLAGLISVRAGLTASDRNNLYSVIRSDIHIENYLALKEGVEVPTFARRRIKGYIRQALNALHEGDITYRWIQNTRGGVISELILLSQGQSVWMRYKAPHPVAEPASVDPQAARLESTARTLSHIRREIFEVQTTLQYATQAIDWVRNQVPPPDGVDDYVAELERDIQAAPAMREMLMKVGQQVSNRMS
jgi:hypothetical protein